MNTTGFFSCDEYKAHHQGILKGVFNSHNRLPVSVFAIELEKSQFFEFDSMITPDYWWVVRQMAYLNHDSQIIVAVLDPDPINYYWKEFGYCNAFKISSDAGEDDYFDFLAHGPESSPADAILYNANVICWTGYSRNWGMWGERDAGIGVLGSCAAQSLMVGGQSIPLTVAANLASQQRRLSASESKRFAEELRNSYR